jgi:hypothetical protein
MKSIWVVCGSTGFADDRQRWIVEACTTKTEAKYRVAALHRILGEMATDDGAWGYELRRAREDAMRAHPRGDPHCQVDRTGTRYVYVECPMPGGEFLVDSRFAILAISVLVYVCALIAIVQFQPGRVLFEHFLR